MIEMIDNTDGYQKFWVSRLVLKVLQDNPVQTSFKPVQIIEMKDKESVCTCLIGFAFDLCNKYDFY